jgi:hypothetical protein
MFKDNNWLLCLDEEQKDVDGKPIKLNQIKLYGSERINHAALDLQYRPC